MKITKHLIQFEKNNSLLLLNGATSKPIFIEKENKRILNILRDVNNIKDHKLIDFLFYHDILVNDEDEENYSVQNDKHACYIEEPSNGKIRKTLNLNVYLLLSQGCNLGCVYCLNGENTYGKSKLLMMSEEVAIKGIDKLSRTIIPEGIFELIFFGGEPLLNWDLAKKIIIYCEEKIKKELPKLQIKYHITSNLTLVSSELIEWAKKYSIRFLCNIDGDKYLHDLLRPFKNGKSSHNIIVKNIEKLNRSGIEVSLRATITSINMRFIKEISKHHKDIGGASSAFVAVNAVTSDEDILPKSLLPDPDIVQVGLRELIESNVWEKEMIFPLNGFLQRIRPGNRNVWCCGAPHGNTPVLDVNGDVYACIYLVGIKRYRLGNVLLDDEYPDEKTINMMLDVINIDNVDECKSCNLRYICGGGCPVGRFIIKGNPLADDEIIEYTKNIACKINKAMIEESLWYFAEKARDMKEKGRHDFYFGNGYEPFCR